MRTSECGGKKSEIEYRKNMRIVLI
jgi:hypothetical protein